MLELIIVISLLAQNDKPLLQPNGSSTGDPDKELLRAVAEGYLDNREYFRHFTCSYSLRVGKSTSEEEARKGVITENAKANCLWVVDGDRRRFEVKVQGGLPLNVKAAQKTKGQNDITGVSLLSRMILRDKDHKIGIVPDLHFGNMFPTKELRSGIETGIEETPLDFGVMGQDEQLSPPRLIERSVTGRLFCRCKQIQHATKDMFQLNCGKSAETPTWSAVLDPNQGFLPIEIEVRSQATKRILSKVFITDIIRLKDGGYFPKRAVRIDSGVGKSVVAKEWVVSELSTEVPSNEKFVIEIPAGTRISIIGEKNSSAHPTEAMRVAISDLPNLPGRIRRSIELDPKNKLPTVKRSSVSIFALIVLNTIIAIGVCIWLVLRRKPNMQ